MSTLTPPPTLAGFIQFLFQPGIGAVPANALSATDPVINVAFCVALEIVNQQICVVSPLMYNLAVYNLATDNVYNFAQDNPPSPEAFFAKMRASLGIMDFVAGVTASTSDEGTSESLLNPEFMKDLKLADLQNLKSPWGRQYLAIAQRFGGIVAFN